MSSVMYPSLFLPHRSDVIIPQEKCTEEEIMRVFFCVQAERRAWLESFSQSDAMLVLKLANIEMTRTLFSWGDVHFQLDLQKGIVYSLTFAADRPYLLRRTGVRVLPKTEIQEQDWLGFKEQEDNTNRHLYGLIQHMERDELYSPILARCSINNAGISMNYSIRELWERGF